MTIFSFGVLGGVALLETGYRWGGRAELATQLTVAAEMKIEELRTVARTELEDTVQLGLGGKLDSDVADHWDNIELDGRAFLRRWRIDPGPSGTVIATVRVHVVKPRIAGQAELQTCIIP